MIRIFLYNFRIAWEAILQNKLRSMLTSLGIICGVGSVIAMLAIGKGAEYEILEKMKLLGTNNIIIKPLEKKSNDIQQDSGEEDGQEEQEKSESKKYSPGLTLKDAENAAVIPVVEAASPEVIIETLALREDFKKNVNLVGVTKEYFNINSFSFFEGSNFLDKNMRNSEQVCIIGSGIKSKLFATADPIGKQMKCGNLWFKVIGVLEEKNISGENRKSLGIRDYNNDVYIPITTMLLRNKNRSLVTKQDIQTRYDNGGDKDVNLNQLDRIVIQVKSTDDVKKTAEILSQMLQRRHNEVIDYEIIVPELLLQQEQSAKRIFNIVLGAIASISLIVGGIGIMNIMLASVLERTKEIGIRMAVGATKRDVLLQFLSEAVAISLSGGIIGIIIGIGSSIIIEGITDIQTIVSPVSVLISFFVSISVGLIFGIMPARKAAEQRPIDLLRYE